MQNAQLTIHPPHTLSRLLHYTQRLPINIAQLIGIITFSGIYIAMQGNCINMWHVSRKITIIRTIFPIITAYTFTILLNNLLYFSFEETRETYKKMQDANISTTSTCYNNIMKTIQSKTSTMIMRGLMNNIQHLQIKQIMNKLFILSCMHILIIGPVNALVNKFFSINPTTFFSEWKKGILLIFFQLVGKLSMPLLLSPINDLTLTEFQDILHTELASVVTRDDVI